MAAAISPSPDLNIPDLESTMQDPSHSLAPTESSMLKIEVWSDRDANLKSAQVMRMPAQHNAWQELTQLLRQGQSESAAVRSRISSLMKQLAQTGIDKDHAAANKDQQQALFDSILEGVHETLEDDTETARARASINDGELLHQLRMQAEGAEAAQDMAAAARYHLERCTSASDDVQVWLAYGLYSARHGQHGRAQQCFRRVLGIQSGNKLAQLYLGCLLWHGSIFTDASYRAEAIKLLQDASPEDSTNLMIAAIHAAITAAPISSDLAAASLNATWKAACMLVDELCLGSCALRLLERLPRLDKDGEEAVENDFQNNCHESARPHSRADMTMCLGRIAALQGNPEEALEQAQQAARCSPQAHYQAALLSASVHFAAGNFTAALVKYEEAASAAKGPLPVSSLFRVARCYVQAGSLTEARKAMQQAVDASPSTAMLVGLGSVCVLLKDIGAADEVLARAHALDSHNPEVWAWLAFAAMLVGRSDEIDLALDQCNQHNLQNAEVANKIALWKYKSALEQSSSQTAVTV